MQAGKDRPAYPTGLRHKRLAVRTWMHFTVDFACFVILTGAVAKACGGDLQRLSALFLLYNIIAFGLQAFIGYRLDSRPVQGRKLMLTGWALVLVAVVLALAAVKAGMGLLGAVTAMAIGALGNAAFHVGAGTAVLSDSGGRMTDSGIFASAGALGVGLGTFAGSEWTTATTFVLAVLCLAAAIGAESLFHRAGARAGSQAEGIAHSAGAQAEGMVRGAGTEEAVPARQSQPSQAGRFHLARDGSFGVLTGLLFLAMVIYGYGGGSLPVDWETAGLMALVIPAGAFAGRALGGILADRWGAGRTAIVSLALALPLLCLGGGYPILTFLGTVLFHMQVAITLCALASVLPDNPAFAFGLTKMALLMGTAVTYVVPVPGPTQPVLLGGLLILECIALTLTVQFSKIETDASGHRGGRS